MKTIIVVSRDIVLTSLADRILSPHFRLLVFREIVSAMDSIFNNIPNMIIVQIVSGDAPTVEILNNLKEDPMFNQIPVLAVLGDQATTVQWEGLFVEDYLRKGDIERDLLSRVMLAIIRSERIVEINPLTRLPGNISINRQIRERMERGDSFSFAYADLADFKPFNDKYGFSRGDEVIKIAGRLILNIVKNRQPQGSFIGHIGGDDFVFIMDAELIEEACVDIIRAFDQIIPTVYDPEDRERGGIESVDRRGMARFFPFIGLAIGVTGTGVRSFSHFGELTGAASEMKNHAKKTRGSSLRMDKRTDRPS
jgi:diguanylate cyclase (GGDEF)-like protein